MPDMPHDRPRILVVDDNRKTLELMQGLMEAEGYQVLTAQDGREALDRITVTPPDLILLDVMMPTLDGFELCRLLKENTATRLIPVVLVTALSESHRIRGIEVGADDFLTKPISQAELNARVRSLLKLKAFTDQLERAEALLTFLARVIEVRDGYTAGHCQRLSDSAAALATWIGLSAEEVTIIRKGAFLHDVGKIGISDAILLKPRPLTPQEKRKMQEHPIIGEQLCSSLKSLQPTLPIIRHHHERFDGRGYPNGLKGDEIPLAAQITAIADAFDALTSNRPYRWRLSCNQAAQVLWREAGEGRWNRDLLAIFFEMREGLDQSSGCTGPGPVTEQGWPQPPPRGRWQGPASDPGGT